MTEPVHVRARKFLQEYFNDEELNTLCFDYFHEVYNDFTQGMTKNQKIIKLVSFCQRQDKLNDLLAALEQERANQYHTYFVGNFQPDNSFSEMPENIESRTSIDAQNPDVLANHQETISKKIDEKHRPISSLFKWYQRLDIVEKIFSIVASIIAIITFLWAIINVIDSYSSTSIPTVDSTSSISFAQSTVVPSPILTPTITVEPSKLPVNTMSSTSIEVPNMPPEVAELGDKWIRPYDDMEMVYVPSGTFLMGGNSEIDPSVSEDELPAHTVFVAQFWIDKYEVSNQQYQLCVQAGECQQSIFVDADGYNEVLQPVVGVTWDDAETYCNWVGGNLPDESQWEFAARGNKGLIYPWGHEFDSTQLNYCDVNCSKAWRDPSVDDGYSASAPRDTFTTVGESWVGANFMAGNVWEWTRNWFYEYPAPSSEAIPESLDLKVIRGGGWDSNSFTTRSTYRLKYGIESRDINVGFRCVFGLDE